MFRSTKIGYIVLSVFLFGSYLGKAQTSLNDYKYIVVPKKFDAFKEENRYQTGSLIKHLFTQKGFTVVWEDDMPEGLANNRCQGLFVDLNDKSSMFSTKTTIVLNDCNKKQVFATLEGKSREKDYKKSYSEAIKKAMASFDGLGYEYNGRSETNEPVTVSFKNDVKKLEEPKKLSTTSEKQNDEVIVQEATREKQTYKDNTPVQSDIKKVEKKEPAVVQISTTEEQVFETTEPVESNIKKVKSQKDKAEMSVEKQDASVLYAQEIPNGYQLVDSSPKILLKILKTSVPDYYLAEGEGGRGMVYTKNGKWYFEHYKGENLIAEELNIKF